MPRRTPAVPWLSAELALSKGSAHRLAERLRSTELRLERARDHVAELERAVAELRQAMQQLAGRKQALGVSLCLASELVDVDAVLPVRAKELSHYGWLTKQLTAILSTCPGCHAPLTDSARQVWLDLTTAGLSMQRSGETWRESLRRQLAKMRRIGLVENEYRYCASTNRGEGC